jgi:hypothetical protein
MFTVDLTINSIRRQVEFETKRGITQATRSDRKQVSGADARDMEPAHVL